ncbi:MAG: S1C family serine protease [Anaerolineae bacterium]
MSKGRLYRVGAALLLLSILGILAGSNLPLSLFGDSVPIVQAQPAAFRDAIYQVVEEVKPAVVQVTNEQVGLAGFGQSTAIPVGVGSGIIYDAQGYVLTNNHVVEGASKIIVSLPDGRAFPATVVGQDPQTDLAVIQIEASDLPVAELADSSQPAVGDWVVAIGNALALPGGPTVTAGLVSATGRTIQESPSSNASQQIPGSGPYLFDLIQTDAAINPGNSGGPLVNLNGQVVGINTLGGGSTGQGTQAQGIGFAISMSTAKPIADQLVANGQVEHPYLGADYVALNPALSAQNNIPVPYGDYITGITTGSPAAKAGLQKDDIITQANGQDLTGDSDLALIIHAHKAGDELSLTVRRGSQTLTIQATLGTTD